jgi:hypothetical protein
MGDAAFDHLKIYCIIIIGMDDPYEVTPFQGLSVSWPSVAWAFDLIASMPADVLERTHPVDYLIGLRMGGGRVPSDGVARR